MTLGLGLALSPLSGLQAQTLRPEQVAEQVYELLPDLPRENQYHNQTTGAPEPNSTLITRLVSYHQYVKRRPTGFRFDWQLTFADYLGVNESILDLSYPGHSTLTPHPLEGDRTAIASLTRSQRRQLLAIIVSIYQPTTPQEASPSPSPEPTNPLNLPQPGDAELLQF